MKNELFRGKTLPPQTSRQFYPHKSDIRNHMNIALAKLKYSKVDQENVEHCVQEWKKSRPGDHFFFRGYGQDVESKLEQKLLFVHQSKEQKRLMRKYGNHIGVLDATYKTTRFAIPLFFCRS